MWAKQGLHSTVTCFTTRFLALGASACGLYLQKCTFCLFQISLTLPNCHHLSRSFLLAYKPKTGPIFSQLRVKSLSLSFFWDGGRALSSCIVAPRCYLFSNYFSPIPDGNVQCIHSEVDKDHFEEDVDDFQSHICYMTMVMMIIIKIWWFRWTVVWCYLYQIFDIIIIIIFAMMEMNAIVVVRCYQTSFG